MFKQVIRLLPENLFYVGKIESWLNDMVNSGLRLKNMHSRYAVFERKKPADIKYCIVELTQYPNDQQLKEYNEAYWDITCRINTLFNGEYVKRRFRFYIFESIDTHNSKSLEEVFGDRKELYERYKTQRHTYLYYLIAASGSFVAAFFNLSAHYILFFSSIFLTITLLFLILTIMSVIEKFQAIKSAKKNKLLGKVTDKDWVKTKKSSKRRLVAKTICWVLIFAHLIYLNYALMAVLTKTNLDDMDSFVRLEDIQQTEINLGKTYGEFTPSLFVPSFYMAEEAGSFYDENGKLKLTQYSIIYSKCIIPYAVSIANRNCVLLRLIDNSNGNQIVFTSSEYFSKVTYTYMYLNGDYSIKLCLSNNNEMIYLVYRGDKTVQDVIKAVEEILYE